MNAPDNHNLIDYAEAEILTGMPHRTMLTRIAQTGIPVYRDGRDLRRRLIDRRDAEKLIAPEIDNRPRAGQRAA